MRPPPPSWLWKMSAVSEYWFLLCAVTRRRSDLPPGAGTQLLMHRCPLALLPGALSDVALCTPVPSFCLPLSSAPCHFTSCRPRSSSFLFLIPVF